MASINQNGTVKVAKREKFSSSLQFRAKPQHIAAIDFGTTHCSLAYQLNVAHISADEKPVILKLDINVPQSLRVPSCILFDRDGNVLSFGIEARDEYSQMDSPRRLECIYLEHIKMKLHRDEAVDRMQKISALNGKEYFLIDVIAHILCHLKEKMLETLHEFGLTLDATDFDWVITVPAIWKARGKQMMREAGYKAGLCSAHSPPRLREAIGFSPLQSAAEQLDKLSLALEPESAAIYCKQEAKKAKSMHGSRFIPESRNYLVLDIGGGTVDIATHSVTANGIAELAPSNGNDFGGTQVNIQFQKFLADFVDDPNFSTYIRIDDSLSDNDSDREVYARRQAELTHLVYSEFETQKVLFGSDSNKQNFPIRFPYTFWQAYKDKIIANAPGYDIQAEDDGGVIRLTPTQMKGFFQPVVDGINGLVESHLREYSLIDTIDTIYLIGGFGGSTFLRKEIEKKVKPMIPNLVMCTLPDASLAVIYGALAFRCDPGVISKRLADASYGIEYSVPFDPIIHKSKYKRVIRGQRTNFCKHIFGAIVERGEHVCTNEVFIASGGAAKEQANVKLTLYSSLSKDVMYTTDRGVYKLGEIDLKLDSVTEDQNSEIELIIDITHTELHLHARELDSDNTCKLVADFLSNI